MNNIYNIFTPDVLSSKIVKLKEDIRVISDGRHQLILERKDHLSYYNELLNAYENLKDAETKIVLLREYANIKNEIILTKEFLKDFDSKIEALSFSLESKRKELKELEEKLSESIVFNKKGKLLVFKKI